MSIRPVDLQVMLPRTSEITRNQNNEGARPEVAQQQFSQQLQKEVDTARQSVTASEKQDEKQRIKEDEDSGKNQKRKKQQKKKTPAEQKRAAQSMKNDGASLVDISI